MSDPNSPLISIVMPLFNVEKYVEESIDSVVNQSYSNWELLLVDDCSTDDTCKIIESKFSTDSRIKLFHNEMNSGAGVSRNVGLANSSGIYIAFLDSDDLWCDNKLKLQVSFMLNNKAAISHTSYSFINELGIDIPGRVTASKVLDLDSYMRTTEIGMSTSLICRTTVGDFTFDSMRTRQDTKLWLTLLGRGFVSKGLNEQLVKYRARDGQISKNKLAAARTTLKVYLSVKEISVARRLLNFSYYCINATLKRIKR
ncbi:glycosyltransferase family 2 protein [Shewanella pealeana]|uniref:Glycosyl transferase family 2 n=1 Tax=Shewanella pealeana (strain ATCC 700345 / ANG-SQ1) TaxID=398579 RepID=A8H2F1_SHEPA|nr:glycosyltransferase family 2 protein [Shewanella pealeana]ABV86738.1 glycosyl transferase family 2 [Shewanella pealeana ATCC 700345]